MKVLYVSHFGELGGAERSLLELMIAVRKLGVEVMLLCPEGQLGMEAVATGIPIATWRAYPLMRSHGENAWWRGLPGLLGGWGELNRRALEFGPNILHLNSGQAMLWNGPVGWLRGCPVVWHWRDFHDLGRFTNCMAFAADAIVAISKSILVFAANQLGRTARRLVLIHNGVADVSRCNPSRRAVLRSSMGIPPNASLVVMAGQSVPRKGHAVLLKALALLGKTHPRLHAWLLCTEYDAVATAHTRRLLKQAAEFGCPRSVRITEGSDQIASVLSAADVVAVPSLREPFGRIAVEAMLAERPVVASAVDGLNEIVQHDVTGLLVPPGDPECLAAGLSKIFADPDLWAARGEVARQRALQFFSVTRLAREMMTLYTAIGRN